MNEDGDDAALVSSYLDSATPDTLLPSQFFASLGSHGSEVPEKRLLLAVLEEAIRCFQSNVITSRALRLRYEAERWFFSPQLKAPFSFDGICEALDLNAEFLRDGLRSFRDVRKLTQRHLVHTERRRHPVVNRQRARRDYRRRSSDLPFVPV